ncbi:MAG TPA: hypothetical protein VFN40_08470 [Gemmatimonadales bacterium]|nr:hypothetical protein [Gemmatimonadales bacterium]
MIHVGFLLILTGAALLPSSRARRAAGLAAAASGLALAGLAGVSAPLSMPGRTALAALPSGFLAADAALLVLGAVLAVGSALVAVLDRRSAPTIAGAIALAPGGILLAWGGAGLVAAAPTGRLVLASLVEVGVGAALVGAGWYLRFAPPPDRDTPHPLAAAVGLFAAALAAAVGPHVELVVLGVIGAACAGYLLEHARGGGRLPLAPAATILLLPAWWLMATIAGPEGLGVGRLAAVPFSPAAERLLAIPLLIAAWAVAGLWPLHRQVPGALVAPVGALLLARVAIPAVPSGLEHWRPLAMPLIVAGVWHAALSGRLARVAVGVAWVGLLAPGRFGLVGAAFLLAAGLAVELIERIGALRAGRLAPAFQAIPLIAFGWGALLAVGAGLQGEVVYTALAVAGLVALCGRPWPQAITASAPSTTSPSA